MRGSARHFRIPATRCVSASEVPPSSVARAITARRNSSWAASHLAKASVSATINTPSSQSSQPWWASFRSCCALLHSTCTGAEYPLTETMAWPGTPSISTSRSISTSSTSSSARTALPWRSSTARRSGISRGCGELEAVGGDGSSCRIRSLSVLPDAVGSCSIDTVGVPGCANHLSNCERSFPDVISTLSMKSSTVAACPSNFWRKVRRLVRKASGPTRSCSMRTISAPLL
mmetsp:Transcript_54784/g.128079  ORF Transcript_54784/g.128079 Transcript_54784/m.128079 type:complete len:231 (+) Transcript_54784:622-1314(+)